MSSLLTDHVHKNPGYRRPCEWWRTMNPVHIHRTKWNKWTKFTSIPTISMLLGPVGPSRLVWCASSRMMSGMISKKGWSSTNGRHPGCFTGCRIFILNHGTSNPVCFIGFLGYRSMFANWLNNFVWGGTTSNQINKGLLFTKPGLTTTNVSQPEKRLQVFCGKKVVILSASAHLLCKERIPAYLKIPSPHYAPLTNLKIPKIASFSKQKFDVSIPLTKHWRISVTWSNVIGHIKIHRQHGIYYARVKVDGTAPIYWFLHWI